MLMHTNDFSTHQDVICFVITVFSLTYVTQVVDGCMEAPDAGSEGLVYPLKLRTTIMLNWYDSPRLRLSTSFPHIVRVADPVSSLMIMSCLVFPPPTICGSVCFVTTAPANDSVILFEATKFLQFGSFELLARVVKSVGLHEIEARGRRRIFCIVFNCHF